MFKHNLKIAFRNLWKYKTQTIISIIGLAVGFTCFSLATLWIRYEMTYDSFHKNAKNLYLVTAPSTENSFDDITFTMPYPLAAYLKETFPEVKEAVSISSFSHEFIKIRTKSTFDLEGQQIELHSVFADSAFMKMFDIKVLDGSLAFPNNRKYWTDYENHYAKNEIAITNEKAQTLFGNEYPIGKILTRDKKEYLITAVVSGYSSHSNFPFDILSVVQRNPTNPSNTFDAEWFEPNCISMLELYPNVNVEAFKQKLYEHEINQPTRLKNPSLIALTDLRTEDPTKIREIKFAHIKLFAWIGILVILCALFNYLTLFVSRFKIRGKEFALRMVCGASLWSLFSLLLAEFLITLLVAVLLGVIILNLISPAFQALSEIQMNLGSVYVELALYILFIILLTVLLFAFTIAVFRKYALNISIRRTNNLLFRKISIVAQLIISIGFVFCTIVMIKQVHYLHNNKDIGFEYKNRSYLHITAQADAHAICDKLRQIPEITDVVTDCEPLIPMGSKTVSINFWDETTVEQVVFMSQIRISEASAKFYGLQFIAGEALTDEDEQSIFSEVDRSESNVLINESAMKYFGWDKNNAVGKSFGHVRNGERHKTYYVKGVIKNVYNGSPTVEVAPVAYFHDYAELKGMRGILFKYSNRDIAEAKIMELMKNEFPEVSTYSLNIYDAEETYEAFLKSENALITILNFMSAICVLISVFGFFSLVSLSCEERRKEIAIRKVNGADVHDIIAIFFKEYSLLLAIGAAIAFPIGYYIMKGWLEQYIHQTTIDAWIYAAILLLISSVIILCVGWRVYKTSRENPADVVKSE